MMIYCLSMIASILIITIVGLEGDFLLQQKELEDAKRWLELGHLFFHIL